VNVQVKILEKHNIKTHGDASSDEAHHSVYNKATTNHQKTTNLQIFRKEQYTVTTTEQTLTYPADLPTALS